MARTRRKTTHSLVNLLEQEPFRFQLFQALRILWFRWARSRPADRQITEGIGGDLEPAQEVARLRGMLGQEFPTFEVGSFHMAPESGMPEMGVAVMGLYGAMGVLPNHDKQRLVDGRRDSRNERDFLDLFNHRVLSLFFRAWAKNWLPIQYERTHGRFVAGAESDRGTERDAITESLYCLAGIGIGGLRSRLAVPSSHFAFHAGHFSRSPKNASALRQMLRALCGVRVSIRECVPCWLELDEASRSEMAGPHRPLGQNAELGGGFVIGTRIRDIASKFRVELGPLDYPELIAFSPLGDSFRQLVEFTRAYVGPSLDFDVLLELRAKEIPGFELGRQVALGINCWLFSVPPTENGRQAVFASPL